MSIDRTAYSAPLVFDAEMAQLFANRMFVGSAFDLQALNDYRSVLFGNRAITVRHTPEGIRAFNNVCLHRNALIDPLGSGNRAFRCNYHGWSYGDDGALKSAPLADETAIRDRRLLSYPISESNGLYFLGQDAQPDVSDIALAFDQTKTILAEPFARGVLEHSCNWKLMVENVLEGYHLSYVHKDTFVQAGFTSTANYSHGTKDGVSWSTMTPRSGDGRDKSSKYRRISPDASHHYNHATHTRLEWALFERPALARLAPSIREHFRADAVAFANATLLEDKAQVESCQLGISSVGTPCQFQPNEGRIAHFHSMYSARMSATLG